MTNYLELKKPILEKKHDGDRHELCKNVLADIRQDIDNLLGESIGPDAQFKGSRGNGGEHLHKVSKDQRRSLQTRLEAAANFYAFHRTGGTAKGMEVDESEVRKRLLDIGKVTGEGSALTMQLIENVKEIVDIHIAYQFSVERSGKLARKVLSELDPSAKEDRQLQTLNNIEAATKVYLMQRSGAEPKSTSELMFNGFMDDIPLRKDSDLTRGAIAREIREAVDDSLKRVNLRFGPDKS